MAKFSNFFVKTIFALLVFWVLAKSANAAVLYVAPSAKNIPIGQEFILDIKVNTESVSINAAQAMVRFPNSILTAIGVDKAGSAFNFWVEEPTISNESGTINFIGGTPNGVSGDAIQILRIKFKASGSGAADVTLAEATVTASDGKGTNVLSRLEGSRAGIGGAQVALPPPVPGAPKIEAPKPVERVAVVANNLPNQPQLNAPLYPDSSRWYSHLGNLVVFWDIPDDVVTVATKLDHRPNTDPDVPEKELLNGRDFGSLEEGIWYAHVQFKNNIGWGPIAHYKISLDRAAPLPFEVKIDNAITDNPSPELRFQTNDALSGLGEIAIFVDARDPIKISATSTALVLPPQPPGKHRIVVRVSDKAGNAVESDLNLEILPLPSPSVDFVTKSVSRGEIIFASGKGLSGGFVDAKLNRNGAEIVTLSADVDNEGNWEISIGELLPVGRYNLTITARDNRQALSYPSDPMSIRVRSKTILSIGSLDLGVFELVILGLLIVFSATGLVYWYFVRGRQRRGAYETIAMRDMEKLSALLLGDVKELEGLVEQHVDSSKTRATSLISKIKNTLSQMKSYIAKEIEKIK